MVTPEVNAIIDGTEQRDWYNRGKSAAVMLAFMTGRRCKVRRSKGQSAANLRQMEGHDEVWELCFRYGGVLSGARLLGRFKCKDLFIGLNVVARRPWSEGHLSAINERWNAVFPNSAPVRSRDQADYLSENFDEV